MSPTMAADASAAPPQPATGTSTKSSTSIFAIPQPIRSLFNHFPLQTYPPNALPACATTSDTTTSSSATETSALPILYIFTSPDILKPDPSPNPTCLKFQTYLRAANIPHTCVSSSNHASPSGALPFLLPPTTVSSSSPLTGEKIISYANDHADPSAPIADVDSHPKVEAYRSLITQAIRSAWLHDLYLLDINYPLLKSIYLPSSPVTHASLLHSLRTAATTSILQTTRRSDISPSLLHLNAISALSSLDALLSSNSSKSGWFFDAQAPSLFDAEVFAYTWLLIDEEGSMAMLKSGLREELKQMEHLVKHRERMYERCWGKKVS